jgi:tRNA pseudouridine13 synthase
MQLKSVPEDFVVVELARHNIKSTGHYALLELAKRNTTTERALSELADALGVKRRMLGYAGAKDARALTRQYVSLKLEQELLKRLKHLNRTSFTVRHVGFLDEQITLGNLDGNRFEIVVRKITAEHVTPLQRIPNYFDEQRFSRANAEIGLAILKKEFKAAAELLLQHDDEAGPRITRHLAERPNDYITALRLLPRNVLLLYVHAYQSKLFNAILARHIKEQDKGAVVIGGPVQITVQSKELPDEKIPIIGFGTPQDRFTEWYGAMLEKDGLTTRDFVVRSIPFLTVEGGDRDAFFTVADLTIGDLEEDDLFPGHKKQRLAFTLPKGCYATMVVKCLYRTGNLSGDAAP